MQRSEVQQTQLKLYNKLKLHDCTFDFNLPSTHETDQHTFKHITVTSDIPVTSDITVMSEITVTSDISLVTSDITVTSHINMTLPM